MLDWMDWTGSLNHLTIRAPQGGAKKEADPLKSERKFKEKGFLVRRESLDVTEGTLR